MPDTPDAEAAACLSADIPGGKARTKNITRLAQRAMEPA